MSLNNITGTKYGLIIPKSKNAREPVKVVAEQNAFGDESDVEEDAKFKQPTFDIKMETLKASLRKTTKVNIEKALEEDASVFQYDEVYDKISREKDQKHLGKNAPSAKKPKYVNKLLEASAVRKLEKELLNERKAQRELEAEKEKYAGKESFVTGAYKAKMAELRELVERRREEEAREETMDITKQDGLGGFYRFMFQQKTGSQRGSSPKQHESITEEHVGAKRRFSVSHSPSPRRLDREESRSQRPTSSSRFRSPSSPPRQRDFRNESNSRRGHTRRQSNEKNISSSSSSHRYHDRKHGYSKRHGSHTRHSSGASRGATEKRGSRHHDDYRKVRDEKKDRREKGSLTTDKSEEKRIKETSPPPGFIRAKPRQTTDQEIQEARERYLARKAAGLNRAVVVHSDDEG